ncbi:hypothetical protein SUDANB171_02106 [Streptomyces sp. enrichment culture]
MVAVEGLLRAAGGPAGVGGVLEWLGARLDAQVAVVGGRGDGPVEVEEATAGFPSVARAGLQELAARVVGGRLASAATTTEGGAGSWWLRLERIGPRPPHRVLVVAAERAPDRAESAVASQVCGVLDLLFRARETDAARRGYQRKARQLRLALFQALMAGDPVLARRMSAGDPAGVLETERARVHLLRCAPGDRDRLAQTYQDPSGFHGRALMVRCPVYDEHLICLIPEGDPAGEPLAGALRELVGANRTYTLGISAVQPLAATAEAYEQARHALAVARTTPDRIAGYEGREPLARLLPPAPAGRWAAGLLRPLDGVPRLAVDITGLALGMPRAGVARFLNLSRTTVGAHVREVESALGMDLHAVRDRAALHLAVALAARRAEPPWATEPDPGTGTGTGGAPRLTDLLETDAARRWARAFWTPLAGEEHHRVRGTLRGWIDANADARRAAQELGLSRTTVTAHLRTAERLLHRDLSASGPGIHDLVHALRISVSRHEDDSGHRAQ